MAASSRQRTRLATPAYLCRTPLLVATQHRRGKEAARLILLPSVLEGRPWCSQTNFGGSGVGGEEVSRQLDLLARRKGGQAAVRAARAPECVAQPALRSSLCFSKALPALWLAAAGGLAGRQAACRPYSGSPTSACHKLEVQGM